MKFIHIIPVTEEKFREAEFLLLIGGSFPHGDVHTWCVCGAFLCVTVW